MEVRSPSWGLLQFKRSAVASSPRAECAPIMIIAARLDVFDHDCHFEGYEPVCAITSEFAVLVISP